MNTNSNVDILIIGAGPSGTVAASILNKKGYSVLIVEKQEFPRFVIGESLLPRCMDNLEAAGFIDPIEKAGFQKKHGAKFIDGARECAFDFSYQFTKGWSWTWQVKRDRFDKVLADEVEKMGVKIRYGSSVLDVNITDEYAQTKVASKDGSTVEFSSKYIIDASGYGRVLPRILELEKPSNFPARSAIFTHIEKCYLENEKAETQIQILNHKNGVWAWVIPFIDGSASIGVVGSEVKSYSDNTSTTALLQEWVESIPALKKACRETRFKFAPKVIKGYAVSCRKTYGNRFVIAGNSAEFVDPIFSSGTTFATETGRLSAELVHKELTGEKVDWEKEYAEYLKGGMDVFKTFIKHWYEGSLQKIFFTKNWNEGIKRQICSILAGYVWDNENPIIKKHQKVIPSLAFIVD